MKRSLTIHARYALLILTFLCFTNDAVNAESATMERAPVGGRNPHAPSSAVERHWLRPLPPMGRAPASWSKLEQSAEPEDCGSCHPKQFQDWQTSLHSKALSQATIGQLIGFKTPRIQFCLSCHAPMAEQLRDFVVSRAENTWGELNGLGLARHGNSCAGCHVRDRQFFGPPRASGKGSASEIKASDIAEPNAMRASTMHGGVTRVDWFEDSQFCAACHQGGPERGLVNSPPLLNTYNEWLESPAAAQGKSCQDCHMPGRRHLWRGIHDPDMTESGLTATYTPDDTQARFEVSNTAVGHAFPTYIEPNVILYGVALDENGMEIPETITTYQIRRWARPQNGVWEELMDTRLMPGDTATLTVPWNESRKVKVWMQIYPLDGYATRHFERWRQALPEFADGEPLIERALAHAQSDSYRLFEKVIEKPCTCNQTPSAQ